MVLKTALTTLTTAPKESWNSVKVTAAAALALLLDPAARSIPDYAAEELEPSPESSQLHAQDGPVGRARERWKEARNEMPEVCPDPCYFGRLPLASSFQCLAAVWLCSLLPKGGV